MMNIRLVGLNPNSIFVQTGSGRNWKQVVMSFENFEDFIKSNRPDQYKEYKESNSDKAAAVWFYHYGETEEMKRKGVAYEF